MLTYSVRVWILWTLYAGTLCREEIGGCQLHPCQNGGICERHSEGFRCLCSQQSQNGRLYGGETCTVALSGCDDNQCKNGGMCSPFLVNDGHTYSCACPAGFTGSTCETPTVFSFESRGYMHLETPFLDPEAPLHVRFSFRTGRPVGTLLQRRVDDLLLSIELREAHLCLRSLRGQSSSTMLQTLPQRLSNNRWHTVEASLGGAVSFIRLLCTEEACTRNSSKEVRLFESAPALPDPGTARQSLVIGAPGGSRGPARAVDEADHPPAFLGCFRDVFVDWRLVLPEGSDAQANVTVGCSDRDKCDSGPCRNRGRCVSQGWRSYQCECHRPYEGHDCAEEYITARFGNKDLESYALFSLNDDPGDAATVSMFIRTRQASGLLLILANSTSQYLRLWLEDGRVKVQVNNFETLIGRGAVNDGHFHLVAVALEGTAAKLFQSAQEQGSMAIRHIQANSGDLVFVGGLPDPRATASFGGYFKGCVQDLRINRKRLQFYPIETVVDCHHLEKRINVAQGCVSDNACAVNPCVNGGACYAMWDDFVCNCPPNTAGRRCEEVKWCELSPCPASAVCQPRFQGFECLSNVTFREEQSVLLYRSDGKIRRSLTSVLLSFRTRQSTTTLLHAQRGLDSLTVSLQESRMVMEINAGGGDDSQKVTIQSRRAVSDGEWHTATLSMERRRWIMDVDRNQTERRVSETAAGDLDFLREGADIFLGGLSLDSGVKLFGCLGSVEIGGLLLPFHLDTDMNLPRPQEERFVRVNGAAALQHGCWGTDVCAPNPCQNQGVCEDLFDLHHCICPSEWTGPVCRDPTDPCVSSPCVYGNCTSVGGFKCLCESGYRGDQCEVEVDMCENSNCSNGATCLKGLESYTCLCPQNLTGQYCDDRVPEIPWYIEINPLPELPVSTCMGNRWKYSCYNGGNCSEVDNTCSCLPGFTGQWCERDVDECASDPCMNGGFCVNYVNRFECVCDINYSGIHCQIDVSDFYLYLFLGLWQNLFQLLSYLVIRLDDGPEVDWGFYIND